LQLEKFLATKWARAACRAFLLFLPRLPFHSFTQAAPLDMLMLRLANPRKAPYDGGGAK
jgi:hypothetical protein